MEIPLFRNIDIVLYTDGIFTTAARDRRFRQVVPVERDAFCREITCGFRHVGGTAITGETHEHF